MCIRDRRQHDARPLHERGGGIRPWPRLGRPDEPRIGLRRAAWVDERTPARKSNAVTADCGATTVLNRAHDSVRRCIRSLAVGKARGQVGWPSMMVGRPRDPRRRFVCPRRLLPTQGPGRAQLARGATTGHFPDLGIADLPYGEPSVRRPPLLQSRELGLS